MVFLPGSLKLAFIRKEDPDRAAPFSWTLLIEEQSFCRRKGYSGCVEHGSAIRRWRIRVSVSVGIGENRRIVSWRGFFEFIEKGTKRSI